MWNISKEMILLEKEKLGAITTDRERGCCDYGTKCEFWARQLQ